MGVFLTYQLITRSRITLLTPAHHSNQYTAPVHHSNQYTAQYTIQTSTRHRASLVALGEAIEVVLRPVFRGGHFEQEPHHHQGLGALLIGHHLRGGLGVGCMCYNRKNNQ